MKVELELEQSRQIGPHTVYRLYWPAEDRYGGWATSLDLFTFDSHTQVYDDAVLIGGTFTAGIIHGGTFFGGRIDGGTFHTGITVYGGIFVAGTFNGGTFHDGRFYAGTFNGGTFRGGSFEGSIFNSGEYVCGKFHSGGVFDKAPNHITRSDGYVFMVVLIRDQLRVWAGCRNFTWGEQALGHWGRHHDRHEETVAILDSLRDLWIRQG